MKRWLLAFLLLAGCSNDAKEPEIFQEETSAYEKQEEIEAPVEWDAAAVAATLQAYLRSHDFNGVALVAQNGNVLFNEGFGLAHTQKEAPMAADHKFQIASLSKSFAAVSILQLVEQGLLSLEATLDQFFPQMHRSSEITVHHLLTHSSGLFSGDDLTLYSQPTSIYALIRYGFYPQYQFFNTIGEGTIYSNVGYDILGAIVEQVSGMAYEDYIQTYILDRVGMPSTGLNREGAFLKRLATPYWGHISAADPAPPFHPSFGFASGGLHSTAYDLFQYIQALVVDQTLLSFESLQKMTRPHYRVGRAYHGYGFFIDARGVSNTISHTGNLLGWHGVLIQELDNAATVILLTNHGAGQDMQKGFNMAQLVLNLVP